MTIQCLNAGKHVFIEKPITSTVEQAKIIEAANNKKIFFVENFMHEYS